MANLTTQTNNSDSGVPVPITGAVLKWARDESGYSLEEVAEKLKVGESKILEWEEEKAQPNKTQVSKLAKMFKRQKTLFLLPKPPAYTLPPSLRKAPGLGNHKLKPKELEKIRELSRIQEMISWILQDKGENNFPLAKYLSHESGPEKAAESFRVSLGVAVDKQIKSKSFSEAFKI